MYKSLIIISLTLFMLACVTPPPVTLISSDELTITDHQLKDPDNKYRLYQYDMSIGKHNTYEKYGIGGAHGFFYDIIYPEARRGRPKKPGRSELSDIGEIINHAYDKDMDIFLGDDWGYPSGMAGGKVVEKHPDLINRSLVMLTQQGSGTSAIEFQLPEDLHDILFAVIYPLANGKIDMDKGQQLNTQKRNLSAKGLTGQWQLAVFARYTRDKDTQAQSTMRQFRHSGKMPDVMNNKAVASFIEHSHEKILKNIENPEQKIEAFYVNEPSLNQTHWDGKTNSPYATAPWTEYLPTRFKSMHGYNLIPYLPAVFAGDDISARRIRLHYKQAVAEQYTDSFARQLKQWTNQRGIKSSGHFLLNQFITQHVQGYGDLMKFAAEFDIQALDIGIPEPDRYQIFNYQQTRFFSSITEWKKREYTIMLLDPIIDNGGLGRTRPNPTIPVILNSVNMGFFHGASKFASYMALTKKLKGWNPNFTGYSAKDFNALNEYIGRIAMFLRGARRGTQVALYYPVAMTQSDLKASASNWGYINNRPENIARQAVWDGIERTLLNNDMEYLIVHPDAVKESEIKQGKMLVGDSSFKYLIMPQMDILSLEESEKIKDFEKQGGVVLWVNSFPQYAQRAENDKKISANNKTWQTINYEQLPQLISTPHPTDFDLNIDATGQTSIGRFTQGKTIIYYVVNREGRDIDIKLSSPYNLNQGTHLNQGNSFQIMDPVTGEVSAADAAKHLLIKANRSLIIFRQEDHGDPISIKDQSISKIH